MRILIATTSPPWIKSGIGTVVGEVSKRLINKMEIEIICTDNTGKTVGDHVWEKIPVHVFKGYTNMYHFSPDLYNKLKHIEEFDLIHIHNYSSFIPLAAALSNNNNIPIIFNTHFHQHGSKLSYSFFRKFYDSLISEYIFNKVQKIICVSNVEKELLKNKFNIDNDKIIIIPNGVNVDEVRNSVPFQQKENLILYVGRLVKYKNVQLIIKSLKYLPEKYSLLIIGDGEYKQDLQRLIGNLNLEKRIQILSGLQDRDVYRWMKTCSILINLSEIEAFGITAIEGLAAKKPIIVSNKAGLAELADRFNEYVYPINVNNTSVEELGKLIIEKSCVESNADLNYYNWDYLADQIEKIYIDEYNKKKF